MSDFDALLEAAVSEQQSLLAQMATLDAQRLALQEDLKRYTRVINAADPNSKKPSPKGPKKPDWRVSSGMIEQIYEYMLVETQNNDVTEFTAKGLVAGLKLSPPTVQRGLNVLHEQGRVTLIRKHRQQHFWGVVA